MKTILIIMVLFSLLFGVLVLYKEYYIRRKYQKLIAHKYNVVKPLVRKLALKESIAREEIFIMAKDPSLRQAVFRILEAYNSIYLFPSEYFTIEKGAESFMVNWLEFPTELGSAPQEIKFDTIVTLKESESLNYYVFKYRANAPRWTAKSSWMLGVAGPYHKNSKPFNVPLRVFSRFNTVGTVSTESEVMWVHNNINRYETQYDPFKR
jgi:hypothetical protein